MFVAVQALREAQPAQIVIAVPAAPESICRERQVTDEEVRQLLATSTTEVSAKKALLQHLDRHDGVPSARTMVWARYPHVGDARATEVWADGQLTLGQLVGQRYGKQSHLVGFSAYTGTVTAASEWGGVAERKAVRPALNGSIEALLHETSLGAFFVSARITPDAAEPLSVVRLGRAIGVIYLPATERQGHYFHVRAAEQVDAMIHIDKTGCWRPRAHGFPAKRRKPTRAACRWTRRPGRLSAARRS